MSSFLMASGIDKVCYNFSSSLASQYKIDFLEYSLSPGKLDKQIFKHKQMQRMNQMSYKSHTQIKQKTREQ
jgi:hypothetical protein